MELVRRDAAEAGVIGDPPVAQALAALERGERRAVTALPLGRAIRS